MRVSGNAFKRLCCGFLHALLICSIMGTISSELLKNAAINTSQNYLMTKLSSVSDLIIKDIIIFGPAPNITSDMSFNDLIKILLLNNRSSANYSRFRADQQGEKLILPNIWISEIIRYSCKWKGLPVNMAKHVLCLCGSIVFPYWNHYEFFGIFDGMNSNFWTKNESSLVQNHSFILPTSYQCQDSSTKGEDKSKSNQEPVCQLMAGEYIEFGSLNSLFVGLIFGIFFQFIGLAYWSNNRRIIGCLLWLLGFWFAFQGTFGLLIGWDLWSLWRGL
jgi:hypothetical protein